MLFWLKESEKIYSLTESSTAVVKKKRKEKLKKAVITQAKVEPPTQSSFDLPPNLRAVMGFPDSSKSQSLITRNL